MNIRKRGCLKIIKIQMQYMKGAVSKRKFKKNVKTIFLNYFKFYNVKQKMNLGKVIC